MDPILLEIPTELKTDRLWLHVPRPGEGKVVHEAVRESAAELKPWLHFARKEQTIEESEKNVRKAYSDFILRKALRYHIYTKDKKAFLGVIGFSPIDWEIPKLEMYYWMRTDAAGKGYMSEAAEAMSRFAFDTLKANRVEIRAATENKASRSIPEKLGYRLEGIMKNMDRHSDGCLMDMCLYAKTT
ncbi:MAG TPA: GNAT family N-acetyltransferase [Bacillales bacterium]|nr:GNAT family N-acetyltransferase [Bacillales bacterium]